MALAYLIEVEMLQAFVVGGVEHYHNDDDLGLGQAAITMIVPLAAFPRSAKPSAAQHGVKNFAELVCHYKNLSNFVIGEHSDKSICLYFDTINLMLLSLITKLSAI